jgi:hypothetical protein
MKKIIAIVVCLLAIVAVSVPSLTFAAIKETPTTHTLDIMVSGPSDCYNAFFDGTIWHGDYPEPYISVGYGLPASYKWGNGFRFSNVAIPTDAKITKAYITFTASRSLAATTVNTRISGDREIDAAAFSSLYDYRTRRGTDVGGVDNSKRTTAQVNWDNIGAWTLENEYLSPDITAIIQEIIDQEGWVSGNHLAIFWDDHEGRSSNNTLAARSAFSYYGSNTNAPQIHIEYTVESKQTNEYGKGKGEGLTTAPGKIKLPGEPAIGKAIGKEDAPGQIKLDGEKAAGKEDAPGQIKEDGKKAVGKSQGN